MIPMRDTPRLWLGAIAALMLAAGPAQADAWAPNPPLQKVATLLATWHDAARNRDVPVKIYYPANASAPCPLIIFSHGLGGNREGYSYLGERWAADGFICVHVQHLGSDDAVWRDAGAGGYAALKQSVADPANAINRVYDVKFAITRMLELNKEAGSPFKGLVNGGEIGMAGHSFGAWTTLAVTGETVKSGVFFVDPRIKAAIAMSAPVVGGTAAAVGMFTGVRVPVFHMTGTRDYSPIGDTTAPERRIPYDQSSVPGTCLLILNGADHMTFSGHAFGVYRSDDARFQALILPASVAFWNATLRGNTAAREWLYHGGFAAMLGTQGTFESR